MFNQRNFDYKIGLYKSNDFTKILEYYFDKYILKNMSKCYENKLILKEEYKNQENQSKKLTVNISTDEVVKDVSKK